MGFLLVMTKPTTISVLWLNCIPSSVVYSAHRVACFLAFLLAGSNTRRCAASQVG